MVKKSVKPEKEVKHEKDDQEEKAVPKAEPESFLDLATASISQAELECKNVRATGWKAGRATKPNPGLDGSYSQDRGSKKRKAGSTIASDNIKAPKLQDDSVAEDFIKVRVLSLSVISHFQKPV